MHCPAVRACVRSKRVYPPVRCGGVRVGPTLTLMIQRVGGVARPPQKAHARSRTTEVSIWRSGMSQYDLSSTAVSDGETSVNPSR